MAAGVLVQVKVPADLLAEVDAAAAGETRTSWILAAIRAALADTGPDDSPVAEPFPPAAPGSLVPAEPSPGVACTAPGCWDRATARYGLRRIPLCPADAAALTGQTYRRPRPPLPGQRGSSAPSTS